MKTKAAKIFGSIKYELCVFVVLAVQALSKIIPNFFVDEYTRLYYLIDYSMGKTSRLFVGSIVKLFNSDPSPKWIAGFATSVVMVVLLISSIAIGKVLRNTENELKPQAVAFIAFFVTGIFTFSGFSVFLGDLDIWMFFAALLAVVCAFNKHLRWFVPLFCVAGVLVHNAFAITYFPLVILTVLYLITTSKSKAANSVVFALSCIAVIALTAFVTVKGVKTATLNYEQLYEVLKNRGGYTYNDYGINYIAHMLGVLPEYIAGMAAPSSVFENFAMMVEKYVNSTSLAYSIGVTSFGVAVIAVFWTVWIKCVKNTQSKRRKLVYVFFMLSSLIIPIGMVVEFELIYWFRVSIITQFALAMLMFFKKDEPFKKATEQIREFFSDKKLLLMIVFIVYATIAI